MTRNFLPDIQSKKTTKRVTPDLLKSMLSGVFFSESLRVRLEMVPHLNPGN